VFVSFRSSVSSLLDRAFAVPFFGVAFAWVCLFVGLALWAVFVFLPLAVLAGWSVGLVFLAFDLLLVALGLPPLALGGGPECPGCR
jgi:hypothetical protein